MGIIVAQIVILESVRIIINLLSLEIFNFLWKIVDFTRAC